MHGDDKYPAADSNPCFRNTILFGILPYIQTCVKIKIMKRNILLLLLSFVAFSTVAQPRAKKFTRQAVKSVQWGTKSSKFVDGFLEMMTKELEKKFTQKLVDSILLSSYASDYFNQAYVKKEDLKLFVVAEFDNNFGGVFRGVRYIVMVPYGENKELWSLNSPPRDIFLVFPKEGVTLQ